MINPYLSPNPAAYPDVTLLPPQNTCAPSTCMGPASSFPSVGNPFINITTPVEFVTNESFDLGGVLITLPNGKLLNLYCGGANSALWGVVCMQQSADGGKTWTPYSGTIYGGGSNPYNCAGVFYTALIGAGTGLESWNSTGFVTPSGALVIMWQTDNGSSPWNFLGYYSRSTDNGLTWSTPTDLPAGYGVPTNANCCVVPANASTVQSSGILLVPVLNSALNSNVLMGSTNDGVTWSVFCTLGNLGGVEEVVVAWAGGNTLIGFYRGAEQVGAGSTPLNCLYSTNLGTSWITKVTNIDLLQTQPTGTTGIFYYTMGCGVCLLSNPNTVDQMVLLFAERSNWTGSAHTWANLRAIPFTPSALISSPTSFVVGQLIDSVVSGGLINAGYPTTCIVSGNRCLVQWNRDKTSLCVSCAALWSMFANLELVNTASPTISGLSVISGLMAGGTAVTIMGSNFKAGAKVSFGSNLATSVVVVSQYEITCNTPAGNVGTVNVSVANSDGVSGVDANAFSYTSFIPALVTSGVSGASVPAVTLNTTGATLLIAVLTANGSAPTVSDSVGGQANAWNYLTGTTQTGGNQTRIAYAYAKSGGGALQVGASHVITPGGTSVVCVIFAVSGTATTSAVLDQSSQTANKAGTALQSYSLTQTLTPTAGAFVVMGFGNNGTNYSVSTPPSGFTGELKQTSSATEEICGACYLSSASGATINPSWTVALNGWTGVVIASFI